MKYLSKISMELRKNPIRQNSLRIFTLQFLILLCSTITNVMIARFLGPNQKGVIDLFKLLTGFITDLGTFGFGVGLLYYRLSKKVSLNDTHGNVILFSMVNGILSLIIGFSGLPLWNLLLKGLPQWAIYLGFGFSCIFCYYSLWSFIIISINKVVLNYVLGLITNIIFFVFIAVTALSNKLTIETTVGITVLNSLISSLLAFILLIRQEKKVTVNIPVLKNSISYGLINYLGSIANLINFRIDQILVNLLLGTTAIGIYSVSVRWAELLLYLDIAISTAALYNVSVSQNTESYSLTGKILKIQLLISSTCGLLLAAISYPLIKVLYGEEFIQAVKPLIFLIPGLVMWSISKPISHYFIYKLGKVWLPTIVAIMSAIINLLINLWFIPRFGIQGASLASTISYSFTAIITVYAFYRCKNRPMKIQERICE